MIEPLLRVIMAVPPTGRGWDEPAGGGPRPPPGTLAAAPRSMEPPSAPRPPRGTSVYRIIDGYLRSQQYIYIRISTFGEPAAGHFGPTQHFPDIKNV